MANAIDITVNATDRASGKIKGIGKTFDGLHQKAQKAMGVIGAIGAVAGGGLLAIGVAGTKMNSTLEQSESRWTTLLKSSTKAEKQMAWMKNYSKTTPFDYEGVDKTATALMGMGLSIKDVNKWLPALGDASAVLGGGTETVNGLGMALGQMNAKGKVSAEEMQQLAERGVNAWQMLADGMGLTQAEVRKLGEDGKLLAKDALPLIYKGMQKTFGGGTANLMKSTTGQAMEASESFSWLAQTLTQGAFNWFGANVLPLINSGLSALTNIFSGGLLEGFQKLWSSSTQAKVILIALAGVILGAVIGAFFALAPAVLSAVVAFAPFLAIGMAVAGLAMIIITYWEPIKSFFVNTFGVLSSAFSGFFMGIWAIVQPILSQVVAFISTKVQELSAFWNEHWGMIQQAFVNVWNFISGFVSTALTAILAVFNFIFPAIKMVVLSVWENIKGLIDGALQFIMGVVQVFAGLFTGNWSKLWEGIKNMLSGAVKFIWNYIQLFFGVKILGILGKFASKGLSYIVKFVSSVISKISSFVGKILGFFSKLVSKAISFISKMASQLVSKFKSMMSKGASAVSSGISKVVSFFTGLVSKVISPITSLASKLVSKFKSMMSKGKTAVSDGVKKIVSGIKNFGKTFLSAGKGLLKAFTDGIKKGIGKAKDAVANGMKKIREFLPFSPAKKGPLSDLDKSGESFFPTWYDGALKKVPAMGRAISGAMGAMNRELERESGMMELSTFTGGKGTINVVHEHKHSGKVQVNGDSSKESVEFVGKSMKTETESDIMSDFRRIARSR